MTRRGSTPFLQTVFKSELVVRASKSGAVPEWVDVDRKVTAGGSWEDWLVYFGGLRDEGYDRLQLTVTSIGETGLDEYISGKDDADELVFGFSVISSQNRRRSFEKGSISAQAGECVVTCVLELMLAEVHGEVHVEPMILAAKDLPGPTKWIPVTKGTILGTSNLIRLREVSTTGPFGDIFEFKWLSFASADNVSSGEWFDIDLLYPGDRPVLYLNEDIENFHYLMNTKDQATGKPSAKVKSRRAMDSSLAVQVMTEALAAVAHRIAELASQRRLEDPNESEFGSIFDELSVHEQTIVEGWRHLLGASSEHKKGYSVCAEIGAMNSSDLLMHLSSVMPRRVRAQAEMETAAEYIIAGGLKPETVEEDA